MNNTTILSQDQLAEMIITESRAYSISKTSGTRHNASDLESYIVEKVWFTIMDKTEYHNIKGIRQAIRTRGANYFNKEKKHDICASFAFDGDLVEDSKDLKIEPISQSYGTLSPEKVYFKNVDLDNILDSLPKRQRLVAELTAGILDSLDQDQLKIAHEILDQKSICKIHGQGASEENCNCTFELWLTIPEIAKVIGCSARTVFYDLDRMSKGE